MSDGTFLSNDNAIGYEYIVISSDGLMEYEIYKVVNGNRVYMDGDVLDPDAHPGPILPIIAHQVEASGDDDSCNEKITDKFLISDDGKEITEDRISAIVEDCTRIEEKAVFERIDSP